MDLSKNVDPPGTIKRIKIPFLDADDPSLVLVNKPLDDEPLVIVKNGRNITKAERMCCQDDPMFINWWAFVERYDLRGGQPGGLNAGEFIVRKFTEGWCVCANSGALPDESVFERQKLIGPVNKTHDIEAFVSQQKLVPDEQSLTLRNVAGECTALEIRKLGVFLLVPASVPDDVVIPMIVPGRIIRVTYRDHPLLPERVVVMRLAAPPTDAELLEIGAALRAFKVERVG